MPGLSAADDYGDDFEDYDDDFEVEFQAPAPPKQQSTLTGASKKKSMTGPVLSDLEAIQDAVKNENSDMANRAARIAATLQQGVNGLVATAKEVGRGRPEKGKLAKGAKSTVAKQAKYAAARPANPLGSLTALNPVVRRARALRTNLTLVSERYMAFDQPPLTEYQLYRLRLRSVEPSARE